jgi:glucoamylase
MRTVLLGTLVAVVVAGAPAAAADRDAPGAPGAPAVYQPADKQGFGTARGGPASPVWFTLGGGRMTEV